VKNIPKFYDAIGDDYDDDLKEFFEKNGLKDKKCVVKKVNLCYNVKLDYKYAD
jgi:hypothetical protein